MLTNLSEIHRIKFNATKHGYSIAKIACLYNAFSERRRSLSQNFDSCACPNKNVIKPDTSGKKGTFYHVENAFLSRLKLTQPISSLKISRMSKKMHFWQKAPRVNGLINEEFPF